jgi:hypothetical protein
MSEDKTEIPGNLDPTDELEAPKAATTNPMLEAILAKVNSIGENLSSFRSEVNVRFDTLEKRMYTIERKFDVFSIELTSVKAGVLDTQNRLDELERKAS